MKIKAKKNKTLEALLEQESSNREEYAIKLIEGFASEYTKIANKETGEILSFVKSYDEKVRQKIGKDTNVLKALTQKWQKQRTAKTSKDEGKEDNTESDKGGNGGSGDEIFITLWIFTGVESTSAAQQEELRAFIEENDAYKQVNAKVLEKDPHEFNKVKNMIKHQSRLE